MIKNRSNNILPSLVIITAILLIGFCTYQLTVTFDQQSNNKVIGFVEQYNSDVRLKPFDEFKWIPINQKQIYISENDRVFSNKNSKAIIKLNTGTRITVQEQSLIRIRSGKIILDQGKAEIEILKTEKPIEIKLKNKTIKLKTNKKAKLTIQDDKKTTITVTEGQIQIKDKGKTVNLKKDEKVSITTEKPLIKLSPNNRIFYTTEDFLEIKFNKTPFYYSRNFLMEDKKRIETNTYNLPIGNHYWYHKDSELAFFKIIKKVSPPNILNIKETKENKFITYEDIINIPLLYENFNYTKEVKLISNSRPKLLTIKGKKDAQLSSLKPGKYALTTRVKDKFHLSKWSPERTIYIQRQKVEDIKAIVIELSKPNQKVNFEWDNTTSSETTFELARDTSFQDIIIKRKLKDKNSTEVTFPVIGTFYWRSKSSTPGQYNSPRKVTIRPTPPPKKPKALPKLKLKIKRKKKIRSTLLRLIDFIFPSAYAKTNNNLINIPPVKDAKLYEIEIFHQSDLTKPSEIIKTEKPQFSWSPKKAGKYKWRLRVKDHWNRFSEFSDFSEVNVSISYIKSRLKKKRIVKPVLKKTVPKPKPNPNPNPKAKPRPKPKRKVVKKKIKKRPLKPLVSELSIYIGPSLIDFSQKNNKSYNIEGTALDSKKLNFHRTMRSKFLTEWFFSYSSTSGKVFNDQIFYFRQVDVYFRFKNSSFYPSIVLNQLSKFEADNNDNPLNDGDFSSTKLGILYKKAFNIGKNHKLIPYLAFYQGNELSTDIGLKYRKNWKNSYHLNTAIKTFNFNESDDETKFNLQYFQLLIGISKLF